MKWCSLINCNWCISLEIELIVALTNRDLLWLTLSQCGELEAIPKKMEADTEDTKIKLKKLEADKEVEDRKMKDVMDSLKTATKVGTH